MKLKTKIYYHICTECGNRMDDDHHPDCMTTGFDEAVYENTETGEIKYITESEFLDGVANKGGLCLDPEDDD